MGGELGRAESAVRAAVGGEEEDRVRQPKLGGAPGRGVGAGKLDESCGAGGVVVRTRADAGVVAVGEHDDRLVREPALLGHEVDEGHAAVAGNRGREPLLLDGVAVGRELAREPARRRGRCRAPRHAARIAERELGGERARIDPVEGGRQVRRLERGRPGHAEGEDEQREPDEKPRAAVEAAVDGPVEGAGSRPPR